MLKAKFCLSVPINDLCLIAFKGVICTWSSNSILEVDLRYCEDPVNYYVHFKDQGFSVDKNLTIGEKGEQVLYKKHKFVMIKIKVTELRRIENKVTTSVRTMLVFVVFN